MAQRMPSNNYNNRKNLLLTAIFINKCNNDMRKALYSKIFINLSMFFGSSYQEANATSRKCSLNVHCHTHCVYLTLYERRSPDLMSLMKIEIV